MGHDPFGLLGSTIGDKYRVDDVVAEGGYAVLYRGFHLTLHVAVALKCLKFVAAPSTADREQFLERFLAEGQLLHRLSRARAGIVQALDAGATVAPTGAWVPYLVLEWLEGVSLATDLQTRSAEGSRGRSLRAAMDLLEPAVEALDYAHGQGVAHRDVKPDNLFIAYVGGARTLKVVDFGIAKVVDEVARLSPGEETIAGQPRAFTPPYAAPEQFNPNLGATGPWTDVYALALVLIELVTGKRATEGTTALEYRDHALDPERRPTFAAKGVHVPEPVERMMARALAVDPRNRFRRASEMWEALRAAARKQESQPAATRTEPAEPMPAPRTSSWSVGPAPAVRTIRVRKPANIGMVAFAIVGVLGAIVVGFFSLRSDDAERTAPSEDIEQPHARRSTPMALRDAPADMIRVEKGIYRLGSESPNASTCEQPRTFPVKNAFFIDRTEVTTADYVRWAGADERRSTLGHASKNKKGDLCNERRGRDAYGDHPINCVDRWQAENYCEWRGRRLPTSEEWEAAARGPGVAPREYPWGNAWPRGRPAVFGTTAGTAPVWSSGLQSPSGLLGMAGNVWEWTTGQCELEGEAGLLRGGSWDYNREHLRSWQIELFNPAEGGESCGFRCAVDAIE